MARRKPGKSVKKATPRDKRLYTLEVFLMSGPITYEFAGQNPKVSRTIQIRGDQTLEELHEAIFDAFDREEEHMYEFRFGRRPFGPIAGRYVMPSALEGPFGLDEYDGVTTETTVGALGLKPQRKFFYWFDFGDDWRHQLTVVALDDEAPPGDYPRVTARVGASPPQYPDRDEEGDWGDEDEADEEDEDHE